MGYQYAVRMVCEYTEEMVRRYAARMGEDENGV